MYGVSVRLWILFMGSAGFVKSSVIYLDLVCHDCVWFKNRKTFLFLLTNLLSVSSLFFPLPVCSCLTFSLKLKSTLLKVRHWRLSLQAPLLASLSAAIDAVAGCLIMLSALPFGEGHCLFGLRLKVTSRGPNYSFTFRKVNSAQPNRSLFYWLFTLSSVFFFFFFQLLFFWFCLKCTSL